MAKLKKIFCANCQKPVYRSTGRFNEGVKFGWKTYCSRKCEYQHKSTEQTLTCENCGKQFLRAPNDISPHNYCSQSCAAIANNKKSPKRKAEMGICIQCGKSFKKRGRLKYCSIKCGREAKRHSPKELLEIIRNAVQKLGRVPARRELKGVASACRKIFGSWNNAVIAAGFHPNRSHSQRMYKRVLTKALDGHLCDSVSELIIDNWFIKNKIKHERNVSYPDTNHKTDWGINSKGKTIFVEYFGLAKDSPRYDRSIAKKKTLCCKHKIKLIEVYPWDLYPKINLDTKLKIFLS